jgi:hypothetical protein
MVCVFPARCVESDLRIPRRLRLASGHPVAAQAAQANHVGGALPAVPDRKARQSSAGEWDRHVRRRHRSDYSVSVAGNQHPDTVDQHSGDPGPRITVANPWSAGCDESCTSGAEGGPGKRARSNPGTPPRSDPYRLWEPAVGGGDAGGSRHSLHDRGGAARWVQGRRWSPRP